MAEDLSEGHPSPERPVEAGAEPRPDLSPRAGAELEWWFVQGQLDCDGAAHEFMLSLFRQPARDAAPGAHPDGYADAHPDGHPDGYEDGHMLLVSALDPASGRHSFTSRISPAFRDNFLREAPRQLTRWGADPLIAHAFLAELTEAGAPAPIAVTDAGARIGSAPFRAQWDDLDLRQTGDTLDIAFRLPGCDRPCVLRARPRAEWWTEAMAGGGGGVGTMAYHNCPRLDLTGTLGGLPAEGTGWIDHQWGGFDWFRGRGKGNAPGAGPLGWDWFGINLDCGTDLILLAHRDMRDRTILSASAVVMRPGAPPRVLTDLRLTAARHWQSRRTMIDYPVAWQIEIPALAATLTFTPAADDQEIEVFGFVGAIWEGAGRVRGILDGRAVAGRARLELQGYGYVHRPSALTDSWAARVDRAIEDFLPRELDTDAVARLIGPARWCHDAPAQSAMLTAPAWDLMDRGGKHWRPVFGLLLLEALGIDAAPFETMLSTIPELAHSGSIIIDDIEDGSELRRNAPSLHLKFGLPTAINAANTLYFLPLLSLADHPRLCAKQRDAIYRLIMQMFVQAHFGQAQDLYWSGLAPDRAALLWQDGALGDKVLQTHALKTAAPVRATAEFACIIARTDTATRAACGRFAESLGVAFQIIDDVKNLSADQALGKIRGEDIAAGKMNYAVLRAVRLLEGPDRRRLQEILGAPDLRGAPAALDEAIALVERSGAPAACEAEAKALVDADWPAISRVLPASRHRMLLRMMLTRLIDRPIGGPIGAPICGGAAPADAR